MKTRSHFPRGITWHHSPRCYHLLHCSTQRPEMSTFMALFGTTAQDVILSNITWNHGPRCQSLQHCSAKRPEMSTFISLLDTTTQDTILHDIAQHSDLRCQHSDIAWYHGPRCQSLQHCSRKQPEMLTVLTLLGKSP